MDKPNKVMKYNCQIIYSPAGITLEVLKDGVWKDVMIGTTNPNYKLSSFEDLKNFALFAVEGGEYKGLQ